MNNAGLSLLFYVSVEDITFSILPLKEYTLALKGLIN